MPYLPSPLRSRSLSTTLTVILVLAVVFLTGLATLLNYAAARQRLRLELSQKAEEYAFYLSKSLELPLWHLDEETIRRIVRSYLDTDLVEKIRIAESSGATVFAADAGDPEGLIEHSLDITHNGLIIGRVEIALTPRIHQAQLRRELFSGLSVTLLSVLVILGVTGILLRRYVSRPVARLVEGLASVADGEYDHDFGPPATSEAQAIVSRFKDMAEQVRLREEFLKEMNLRLEREVQEHRKARLALRESEEKYRILVESAADAVFILQDGRVKFPNPRTLAMTGCSAEELEQALFRDLLLPEDRDRLPEEEPPHDASPPPALLQIVSRPEQTLWVELTRVPIPWEGRPAALAVMRDITQQRELEERLRQSQKMEAVGTLAGGIAHDFNNIMGIVIGNAELAIQDVPRGHPARGSLEEIKSACLRARNVVRQLLSFSRKAGTQRRPVKLGPILKDSLALIRASIPTSIEIRQHIAADTHTVLADATQVNQLLLNLCGNAAHAMEGRSGILDIFLGNLETGPAERDPQGPPGRLVKLTVTDTGSGMPRQVLERIFDPYFTTKEPGKGTGMGLAVVHGIVEEHQARIRVKSAEGRGSTFEVFFPAVDLEADKEQEAEATPAGGTERILLVDDEPSLARLLEQMLVRLGYTVTAQTDPREALGLFRSDPRQFDLVITDMTMPWMTGDRLAQQLLEIRPAVPIIISTGFSESMTPEKAASLGVRRLFMKPYRIEELAAVLREVLAEENSKCEMRNAKKTGPNSED